MDFLESTEAFRCHSHSSVERVKCDVHAELLPVMQIALEFDPIVKRKIEEYTKEKKQSFGWNSKASPANRSWRRAM